LHALEDAAFEKVSYSMQKALRTFYIHDQRSTYAILDNDDKTHLYAVSFSRRQGPQVTVARPSGGKDLVGTATYHTTKRLGFSASPKIILNFPTKSGSVSLNREGGLLSSDKRVLHSSVLGEVHFRTRVDSDPWKNGALMTSFIRCVDGEGRDLLVYRDESYHVDRMGCLEIDNPLSQEGLDEVIVSAIAILSVERINPSRI